MEQTEQCVAPEPALSGTLIRPDPTTSLSMMLDVLVALRPMLALLFLPDRLVTLLLLLNLFLALLVLLLLCPLRCCPGGSLASITWTSRHTGKAL